MLAIENTLSMKRKQTVRLIFQKDTKTPWFKAWNI